MPEQVFSGLPKRILVCLLAFVACTLLRLEYFAADRTLLSVEIDPHNLVGRDAMTTLRADRIEAGANGVEVDLLAGNHVD